MKGMKAIVCALASALLLSGCNLSNTAKGGMIGSAGGGAAGAGLGAAIGALAGGAKGAKLGAMIGAGVGVAGGTTAGLLIGKKMDKAKAAAEKALAEQATVETTTDSNGLEAIKITIEGGILFASGKADLTASAKTNLSKFANNVLNVYSDCDVAIHGYSDSDLWKGKNAAESENANLELSQNRANSVRGYFVNSCGVSAAQIKQTTGFGQTNLVLDANGRENKAASRRVELYLYASEAMINAANAGTLQ